MAIPNNAAAIRHDILYRLSKEILEQAPSANYDYIPVSMRPRHGQSVRCCVYRDRAMIKQKIMAMLGFVVESEKDEITPLSYFVEQAFANDFAESQLLRVVTDVCKGCQDEKFVVTNMCKACVGRPCQVNCPKDAIDFEHGQAHINPDLCVKCGLCERNCPYSAIIQTRVPCESACPVGAIYKDNDGHQTIDFEKCIYCGRCIEQCPFGAVVERTHLFDTMMHLQSGGKAIALVAPSFMGQYKVEPGKLFSAIRGLGFSDVIEVAEGALQTIASEAAELQETITEGRLLTSSCCPAYVNLAKKHLPELAGNLSHTASPMVYIARKIKEIHPDAALVFVGPCLGKKHEASEGNLIDWVLNFEEMDAWFRARELNPNDCLAKPLDAHVSAQARGFALAGGVLAAIEHQLPGVLQHAQQIDGIDKETLKELKRLAKQPDLQFLEVMSCANGCVGGCATVVKPQIAKRQLNAYLKG